MEQQLSKIVIKRYGHYVNKVSQVCLIKWLTDNLVPVKADESKVSELMRPEQVLELAKSRGYEFIKEA